MKVIAICVFVIGTHIGNAHNPPIKRRDRRAARPKFQGERQDDRNAENQPTDHGSGDRRGLASVRSARAGLRHRRRQAPGRRARPDRARRSVRRTQDSELLPNVNSSRRHHGQRGDRERWPQPGRRQPQLRPRRPVATVLKGYLTLDYKWRDYGAVASAKAWYDYALANRALPWGNFPTATRGRAAERRGCPAALEVQRRRRRQPLRLRPQRRRQGSLDWTVGYQKLDWGNRYVVLGRAARPQPARPSRGTAAGRGARSGDAHRVPGGLRARRPDEAPRSVEALLPVPFPAQRAEPVRHVLLAAATSCPRAATR